MFQERKAKKEEEAKRRESNYKKFDKNKKNGGKGKYNNSDAPKWCSHCSSNTHNTKDCRKKKKEEGKQ